MNLLMQIIAEEKPRIEKMINGYEQVLLTLPKGVLSRKTVKNHIYYYLQYREGKKTISMYIGNDPQKIEQVQTQIERRKHIEPMTLSLVRWRTIRYTALSSPMRTELSQKRKPCSD